MEREEAPRAAAEAPAAAPARAPLVKGGVKRFVRQQVPSEILEDKALNAAASVLPSNYSFEIHKTVWRVRQAGARRVALQFPEGLLLYACTIADILQAFAGAERVFVLGDVAYGACCVDDFTAAALGADLLVHYGHSCLVPVDVTGVPCMYVFVDIQFDVSHLVEAARTNFEPDARLVLAGTVQFASMMQKARDALAPTMPNLRVPQCKPLSPGEVLGCTAPVVDAADAILFVADGRFHLEAIMIANPDIPAYRYDPYGKTLTRERYDHVGMRAARRAAVETAMHASRFGVVLGTLGRQGSPATLQHVEAQLRRNGREYTVVLMSEIHAHRLLAMSDVQAWVQIACPRLSIDWGEGFEGTPLLTPYELGVAMGEVPPFWSDAADDGAKASKGSGAAAGASEGGVVHPSPSARSKHAGDAQASAAHGGCDACGGGNAGGCGGTAAAEGAGAGCRDAETSFGPRYPMDYYDAAGGAWNGTYRRAKPKKPRRPAQPPVVAGAS
eukprot:PRCOL_00005581-RA